MQIHRGLETFSPPAGGIAVSIGNFDGVHRGHAAIIAEVHRVSERLGVVPVAMTFDVHPLMILSPERAPAQLTTLPEKLALLEQAGLAHCIVLHAEPELLARDAEDFLATLVAHCRPRAFIEGPDFNFGRARAGSLDTLRAHADRWQYEVLAVPAVRCDELRTLPIASSTSIRQALRDGRVDEANVMLGRPYRITGQIGHGEGRGASLGFPTANLEQIPQMLPQEAVYAAVAQLPDDSLHLAAVNVGPQPTFDQEQSRVEAYVLDYAGSLRGGRVALHMLVRLRGQVRFDGPEQLVKQIEQDVAAVRACARAMDEIRKQGLLPL